MIPFYHEKSYHSPNPLDFVKIEWNFLEVSRNFCRGSWGFKKHIYKHESVLASQLSPESTAGYYWGQLRSYLIQEQSFGWKNLNSYCPRREKIIGKYFTPFLILLTKLYYFICINESNSLFERKYHSSISDKFPSVDLILITSGFPILLLF